MKRSNISPSFISKDEVQDGIAGFAVEEFNATWLKNTKGRGDGDWLAILRQDNGMNNLETLSLKTWSEFVRTYEVARNFPASKRKRLAECLNEWAHGDGADAPGLAAAWESRGVSRGKNVSAASKVLFYARPDRACVIFDSKACLAVGKRIGKTIKVDDFSEFRDAVLKIDGQMRAVWKKRVQEKQGVPFDFISRRLTDKHLFIEGALLEATTAFGSALTTLERWGFLSQASIWLTRVSE